MLGGHGIVGGHIPLGHRHGVRREVPAEGLRDAVLLRRGGGQHRHLPRIAQHGGALEAAGHLHRREQPVRHGHGDRAVVGHLRRRPARLRLRHGQRDGRRHGRPGRARGDRPRRRPGAPREPPTLIEARCYRFMGHSMSDPVHGHYRTKEEVEGRSSRTRSGRTSSILKAAGLADQALLEDLDRKARAVTEQAVQFAEASPEPSPTSSTRMSTRSRTAPSPGANQ